MEQPYTIYGGLGSPYSMKMRAILRYRRLPHVWVMLTGRTREKIAGVRPPVIPVIAWPDGALHVDSSPMIEELEARHAERSIVPEDKAQAFLAHLLEDMADEWGTKMMFHYRWFRERDQKQMSDWLAYDNLPGEGLKNVRAAGAMFRERQVGRMALVGCTEGNKELIEATADRVMELLDAHVTEESCLFGSRPSLADFGWYGQLSQLGVDPTPADRMRERAPFLFRWLEHMSDASGVEGKWRPASAPLPAAVRGLLELAGQVYMPFLSANAAALQAGEETFRFSPLGPYAGMGDYEQGTFKYQAKCLTKLRERLAAQDAEVRARLQPVLEEAGCWNGLCPSG